MFATIRSPAAADRAGDTDEHPFATDRIRTCRSETSTAYPLGFGQERWTPGEEAAHERLQHFVDDRSNGYPEKRDEPAAAGTSSLSPYLHFGEISPRQIWHDVNALATGRAQEPKAQAHLRQLGWRDFAHHLLYQFPNTQSTNFRREFEDFPWRKRGDHLFDAWRHGETGIPLVDAGMRELWATGNMHNRVRMNVVSFLTKNAMVHWLEGACWFWDTLVDADLANNTLGWQWSAGCGADAAPYFRIFNPVRQGQKFDPQGIYVRRWLPELRNLKGESIHSPWTVPGGDLKRAGITLGADYPRPIVDLSKKGTRKGDRFIFSSGEK